MAPFTLIPDPARSRGEALDRPRRRSRPRPRGSARDIELRLLFETEEFAPGTH
jgi:hypothetical protein